MSAYGKRRIPIGIRNCVRIVTILTLRALPPMSEPPQLPEITLIGDSGTEIGKLLLELMLWMAEGVIDLTGDRPNFTPPPNTKVTLPPGVEMPTNIHILGTFTTTYSM